MRGRAFVLAMPESVLAMNGSVTPDGRYIVVQGLAGPRLWRASNPALGPEERQALVEQLMDARRAIRYANGDEHTIALARSAVDRAKRSLGERGAIWWTDGAPDLSRHLVANSPYKDWWEREHT